MKKLNLKKLAFVILGFSVLSISAISCKKDATAPDNDNGTTTGTHSIDPRLVGKWLWTEGSDAGYYDDNGVYSGSGYGFAMQFNVDANGNGTCFSYVRSSIGGGTGLEVDIWYKGFFEMDNQGHMGFYPTSGTYKSTSGTNRALRPDELWNVSKGSGRSITFDQVTFTTQGGRECFQVTGSDQKVDAFFKVP